MALVDKGSQSLDLLESVFSLDTQKKIEKIENVSVIQTNPEEPIVHDLEKEFESSIEQVKSLATDNFIVVCGESQNSFPINWVQDNTSLLRMFNYYRKSGQTSFASDTPANDLYDNGNDALDSTISWDSTFDFGANKFAFIHTELVDDITDKFEVYDYELCVEAEIRMLADAGPNLDVQFGGDGTFNFHVHCGNGGSTIIKDYEYKLIKFKNHVAQFKINFRIPWDGTDSWFDWGIQTTLTAAIVTSHIDFLIKELRLIAKPLSTSVGCDHIEYYMNGVRSIVNENDSWFDFYGQLDRDETNLDPNYSVNVLYRNRSGNTYELDNVVGAIKTYSDDFLPKNGLVGGVDIKYDNINSVGIKDMSNIGDWLFTDGPLNGLTKPQISRMITFLRNDILNSNDGRTMDDDLNNTVNDLIV